ncbi:MAG TPA: EAL domain-containing protein [Solirubrobacteraceae bacterium]|jgi:diguanylate cyclase (GGDEF)-like protein/PAS domain S-box-containing protein|nr:EAL domain-containing protein [Solirubrobacteraceae bacterium]
MEAKLNSDQRLSLIIETQREISAAGDELHAAMQLIAERSQAIIGADGAMVNLLDDDMLHTLGVSGTAVGAFDARRPMSGSVARFAIGSGQPILIEDCPNDPRIDQVMRAKVGDQSLICVPLFRGQEVIGTLNVMRRSESERLTEDDRETLEMISVVLSAAVSRAAEVEARRAQATAITRFRTLFDGASIGILRLNCEGLTVEVNPELALMLGVEPEQMGGARFSEYIVGDERAKFETMLAELLSGERKSFQLELCGRRESGAEMWMLLRAVMEEGTNGDADSAVAMIENITDRKHAERELIRQSEINEHQALHDPLTGLPNRTLFSERIGHAIRQAQRSKTRLAVALIDLDRFKEVNDSLGHSAGDHLLINVGERMSEALRASDTVARLGGDEFGLLLPELTDAHDVLPVLERLQAGLEQPIHVQSLPIGIEASIGIAIYPDHGEDAQTLIQRADVAMYDAKRDGCTYTFYDDDAHDYDVTSLTLVAELRRAIAERELVLYYQPKAALASGSVTSVEALVRWVHPERGMVFPDSFIPIAQETSLIGPLTLYVIEEALRQVRAWSEEGLELTVAVNLSTRNLLDRGFPNQVAELLRRWEVASEWLELEVTESSMLANPTRAKAVLGELSALGIRLSIDDFGTGYSSLAYLRQLPIDEIKIDRSFVIGMGVEAGDAVIVRSTVDLGRNLGLEVVAEGVETVETWECLRELGCNTAQGYFLSRPMPAEQMSDWLRTRLVPPDVEAQPA